MDPITFLTAFAMVIGFYFGYRSDPEPKTKKTPNWRETYAEELKELDS